MKEYFIYIDESGNTGSNLLDPDQPFLTFMGIGFDKDQVSKVEKEVGKLKRKFKMQNEILYVVRTCWTIDV